MTSVLSPTLGPVARGPAAPGVVTCAAYAAGRRVADVALDEIHQILYQTDGFIWIGLYEPDEALLRIVQREFGLHDLAIEDAHRAHQRPKLEQYQDSLFVVLRTAHYDEKRGEVVFGEIHIFAGRGFAITLRHGSASELSSARERLEARPQLLESGPLSVVWAVLDKVVDDYEPVAARLTSDIEDIEVHDKIEEEVVYPSVAPLLPDWALEAEEEHEKMRDLIEQIQDLEPGDPAEQKLMQRLERRFNIHASREAAVMFPVLKTRLQNDAYEMGRQAFAVRQGQLTSRERAIRTDNNLKLPTAGWRQKKVVEGGW